MWQYWNPVKIIFTETYIDELIKLVDPKRKTILICSQRFLKTDEFKLLNPITKSVTVFTYIENDPSFDSCDEAIRFAKSHLAEDIIAIGGGSVIDTAKAVRLALVTRSNNVTEMLKGELKHEFSIGLVAIPTTHGTASELTKWATIWNKKEKKKYSLSHDKNYPDYAIYDYHFVQSLPLNISLITTLDALSHSFEALWNNNANPISDAYAIKAIELIYENINKLSESTSIETRINLLKATMYSGLAFSNTKTAAAHSISYPLTSLYGIPHGIACSISLRSLFLLNATLIEAKIEKLLHELPIDTMNVFWGDVSKSINNKLKYSLSEYGIERKNLNDLIDLCFTKGRMDNNIKKITRNDVKQILEDVF